MSIAINFSLTFRPSGYVTVFVTIDIPGAAGAAGVELPSVAEAVGTSPGIAVAATTGISLSSRGGAVGSLVTVIVDTFGCFN